MVAYVYMVRCADGRLYIGSTRGNLEHRIDEHNAGTFGGFTKSRRPVHLVYQESFADVRDAIAAERQLKGWSRAKKEALICGDIEELQRRARSKARAHPSSGSG